MTDKYEPLMKDEEFEKYIAEYMDKSQIKYIINSNEGIASGIDEHDELLFLLLPNIFDEDDFKIYDILDKVAESNLNTNRGASAGILDKTLESWSKKDNHEKVKNEYEEATKYSLIRNNPNNPKIKYRISNPVNSNILGYYDKVDINSRKFVKNPPKCRLTSFTNKNFKQYKEVIPYVEKISNTLKEYLPHKYKIHCEYIANKPKIGDSVFTTLTINKNFQTAIHTDSGDLKSGIGVISCMGNFKGGNFCFPNYGIQIELKPTDLLFCNVHKHHCNTPITGNRISVVSYIREKMNSCDKEIDYKIILKEPNEDFIEYLKSNTKADIYLTQSKNTFHMRFDDIRLILKDPSYYFTNYTPLLYFNEIPNTEYFENDVVNIFKNLYKNNLNSFDWGKNKFETLIPIKQIVATLIEDRITTTIVSNIHSWIKQGYSVQLYSYIDIPANLSDALDEVKIYDANTICKFSDKYIFVMNLLELVDCIYIDNDVKLMKEIPKDKIIITSEYNKNMEQLPNLAICKIPRTHPFVKDSISFFSKDNYNDNKRRFGRCIDYFALQPYIKPPSFVGSVHRIYSKSLFIDYNEYLKQKKKYNIDIPNIDKIKEGVGLKTGNINTLPLLTSIYSLI